MNEFISSMTGEDFELFVAEILKKIGYYNIRLTKGSGDQGVDILAERDEIKYAIQCKRYSQPVGNKAVQEVFSGKTFYHCHVGVVVTNNYFTQSAKDLARENGVVLWDKSFLEKYSNIPVQNCIKENKDALKILNAEEKIIAIENNRISKILYQYLYSASKNAVDLYLRNGDGGWETEEMITCIEKPIKLYNAHFNSLLKYIFFIFYCGMTPSFRYTSTYSKFADIDAKSGERYDDDLFKIQVIYSIDDIILRRGKIEIENAPEVGISTTTMEAMQSLEDIDNSPRAVCSRNKIYYEGYVTEDFFPMKISNIHLKK